MRNLYSLMKSWAEAASNYSVIVSRLVDAHGDRHSQIYDEATDALEIIAAAQSSYQVHRPEHQLERLSPFANQLC
jgi:hypothetical protein